MRGKAAPQPTLLCIALLLVVVTRAAAGPAPSPAPAKPANATSAPAKQAAATSKPGGAPPAPAKQAAPPSSPSPSPATAAAAKQGAPAAVPGRAQAKVAPFDPLPCELVRCSTEHDPVCGIGKGAGSCGTPEAGCTYTNVCLAQCTYGIKSGYKGACKGADSMQVVEAGQRPSSQPGRQ